MSIHPDHFFTLSPSMLCLIGFDGYFKQLNPTWEKVLGWPVAELQAKPYLERVHPADQEATLTAVQKLIASPDPISFENRCLCQDGSYKWLLWNTTAFHEEQLIYAIISDITKYKQTEEQAETALGEAYQQLKPTRKQLEEALRQAKDKYFNIFENAVEGIFQITPTGQFITANMAMARMLGYESPEELLASTTTRGQRCPVKPEHLKKFKGIMAKHSLVKGFEAQVYRRDGSLIWISENLHAVYDNGRLLYYEGFVEDITERKRVEEELRESEEIFRHVVSSISDHIYVTEIIEDGRHLNRYLSPHAETLTGYPLEKFMANWRFWPSTVIHPDDRVAAAVQAAQLAGGQDSETEYRLVRADGQIIWVRDSARVKYEGTSKIIYGIVSDITARRQAEEALRESEQQYRRRSAELQVLYDIALRINTPMAMPELLNLIVEQVLTLLEAETGGFYIYDPLRNVLVCSVAVGFYKQFRHVILKPGEGLIGRAFADHRPQMVADYHTWSGRLSLFETEERIKAALAVPLPGTEGVLGVLFLSRSSSKPVFDDHDLWLTELFAAQAAVAMENAQLHLEAQRRTRELTARNKAMRAMASSLDLKIVLEQVITEVKTMFDAEGASVLLINSTHDDLVFAAVAGLGSEKLVGMRVPLNVGIVGRVMQERRPVLVDEAQSDPRFYAQIDSHTGFTTHSLLAAPLFFRDKVIGVIEVINKAQGMFDSHDLELLECLSNSAAIAIENARLFEEARTGRERLRTLSRRLVEIQENERRHISRELHDEASQALTSLMVGLHLLEQDLNHPEAMAVHVAKLKHMTNGVLENLHGLARELRPVSLDKLGLIAALRQYIKCFSEQHNLVIQFEAVSLEDKYLQPAVETALYRIVQEALTNAARHAQATHIDVFLKRRGEQVITIVEDNGVGFDVEVAQQGGRLGLFGMQERAEMLGGVLIIESTIGAGTTILVEVPYAPSHSD